MNKPRLPLNVVSVISLLAVLSVFVPAISANAATETESSSYQVSSSGESSSRGSRQAAENSQARITGLVNVLGYRGSEVEKTGTGIIVQSDKYNGYVITNSSLVRDEDTITVRLPGSTAELIAQELRSEPTYDIIVLKVNGLNAPSVEISPDTTSIGSVVWSSSLRPDGQIQQAKGLIRNAYQLPANDIAVLSHDAVMTSDATSSVLSNDCGQIVGFNMAFRNPDGQVRALNGKSLQDLLSQNGIGLKTAPGPCLSEVTVARDRADKASEAAARAQDQAQMAQSRASDLEQRLRLSDKRNTDLVSQTRDARAAADEALKAAELARQNAEEMKAAFEKKLSQLAADSQQVVENIELNRKASEEKLLARLEKQQASQEEQNELLSILIILLGTTSSLLLIFGLVMAARKIRYRQTPQVQAGQTSAYDASEEEGYREYVFDGRDEDGIRYLLRISGDRIGVLEDGVIIGRNPKDSPYVINHADVSRKHARLKLMKDRMFIEDLGSTNGTSVNGQAIDAKGPVEISNGDQIIIGSVVMKLRVMGG